MICLCIGICQLGSISEILRRSKTFTSVYKEIIYYAVFDLTEVKMKDILENDVKRADLILSQPVSNNYKGTDLFSTKVLRDTANKYNKKHYVISNCYFTGYDPNPFQTTDLNGSIIHINEISYYPSISFTSILNKDLVKSCVNWCKPDAYSKEQLDINIKRTLDELVNREKKIFDNEYGIDIIISDFIRDNYTIMFLFHTYNHPTNLLLLELFNRIMHKIGLPTEKIDLERELLGDFSIPPPPSVYYKMGMKFEYPRFYIKGQSLSTSQAMKLFIESIGEQKPELINRWKSTINWGLTRLETKEE